MPAKRLMQRRTLLKLALALGSLPVRRINLDAQATSVDAAQGAMLKEVAASVLPESLGRERTDAVADLFLRWLMNYRAGVSMDNGYGATRVQRIPPSPAARYQTELAALEASARALGRTFASLTLPEQRLLIEAALGSEPTEQMPNRPGSQHVALDLMTFYFRSSDATDRCYRAAIRRYDCRGLNNVGEPPRPLGGIA